MEFYLQAMDDHARKIAVLPQTRNTRYHGAYLGDAKNNNYNHLGDKNNNLGDHIQKQQQHKLNLQKKFYEQEGAENFDLSEEEKDNVTIEERRKFNRNVINMKN